MSLFHAGIASATLLLAVVGTSAQQKPNFSGTWVVVSPAESAGEETTISMMRRRSHMAMHPKGEDIRSPTRWMAKRLG
jgi:hypothetical protein